MAGKDGKGTLQGRSGSLVDGLAHTVISQVRRGPENNSDRRLEAGTQLLLSAANARAAFDAKRVASELDALLIDQNDVLNHCIPEAARSLGRDWLVDRLSFAHVTTASARLFGLCKEVSSDWYNAHCDANTCSILLATIGREDHMVGPAVLTERLRRDGHSVYMLLNTDAETILARLRNTGHDALMISCGSFQTLDLAAEAIRTMKTAGVGLPILLGGAVVGLDVEIERNTGADLVTNDIETALDTLAKLVLQPLGAG